MSAVRSFYDWASAMQLLTSDIASRMTELQWFPAGTPQGGEFGRHRRVLVEELRTEDLDDSVEPAWIDDAGARRRFETLQLRSRNRFLLDLMYYTGIRAGEALSLFTADMHFGGGSPAHGCRLAEAHFHVRLDNPVENGARAKGGPRVLYVNDLLVERYIDYVIERQSGTAARLSPHVFVNLYGTKNSRGEAMKYDGVYDLVTRVAERIEFPLSGPHMLRHTFATRLIRGIECDPQPMDVVQSLLGHASIDSTRIYTHDHETAKKAALASIAPRRITLGGGM
jgi:integrase